jgi:hypothetical protein
VATNDVVLYLKSDDKGSISNDMLPKRSQATNKMPNLALPQDAKQSNDAKQSVCLKVLNEASETLWVAVSDEVVALPLQWNCLPSIFAISRSLITAMTVFERPLMKQTKR